MGYDSAAVRTAGGSGTPATWTHTTVAASTTLLVAAALDGIATGASATCAATGLTFTQLGADVPSGTGGTTGFLRVWSATGVASGAHAITVTCATANDISGGSIAYVTTGLGTPVTNAGSANGATSFITLTGTTGGNTVCAFIGSGNSITATSGPATSRFADNLLAGSGESVGNCAGADVAAGGSVTVTWSDTSSVSATFAVEVQAAPGGQRERMPQQLSRITKHRRGASQRPQYNAQLPYVNINVTPVTATASVTAPSVTVGKPYIAGVAGTPGPGWFTDQGSNPRLWVATETWGLPTSAGAWSGSGGGTWQQDYDNFFANRAAQGFTVMMTDPVWSYDGTGRLDGTTWDGLTPLIGGSHDPSSAGLNSSYWARIDYMFSSALGNGITIGFMLCNVGDNLSYSGDWQYSWTTAQWQAWGALIGARYKSQPNVVWLVGNDMFSPYSDTQIGAVYTGVTSTGDTHMWSAWYNSECTSRYITDTNATEDWGVSYAAFNFTYTYNTEYWIIEYAYNEVAKGSANLLPVTWGDGYFYNGTSGAGYVSTYDRAERQEWWWALASGSRGVMGEAENTYPWSSGACVTAVTGNWFFANNALNIVTAFTALPEWNKLIPDLSSAFVTAGRGTRVTGYVSGGSGGQYEPAFTNSYVAASITPDGNLAVCYLPNHTTITVTTSMLTAGWVATWIDPISGASSSAGTGTTYNSTAKGTNSQGDPDWVLVFQVGGTSYGTASATGAGAVTALVTQGVIATAAGAGAVTAHATVIAGATAAAAGAVADVATQIAPASAAGAGSVSGIAVQAVTGTAAGAGTSATAVTWSDNAAAAGAGAATALALQAAISGAAGAGSTGTDPVTQIASASAAGAGSVTAAGSSSGAATAAITGAGAATALATQIAPATAAAAGADTAVATQAAGAALAGAGSAGPAPVTQAAASAPAGTSAVTGAATQTATAQAAGAGAVTAIGSSSGAATGTAAGAGSATALAAQGATSAAAGAGTIAATPAQAAPGTAAGAGSVTGVATQAATASAAGAGSVTATGTIQGGGYAAITGAGAATALAGQAVTAAPAGAGAVNAAATQAAKATAAGAGAVNAAGVITGTASAAGAGAATAKAAQGATAAPAGAGALAALAAQAATAALAGAGATTAAGNIQLAFTVGTLTAADAPLAVLTAATAAGAATAGTLTASDQRTGGPG